MAEGIKIEAEKMRSFRQEFMTDPAADTGNGLQSEAADNPADAFYERRRVEILEKIERSLNWTIERVHKMADDNDYPGIGDAEFRQDYGELWMMSIEDWSKDMAQLEFLEKTPKILLALSTVGILAQNGIAISRKRKES